MGVTLEVCVDTAAGLAAAVEGGADRVELCAALGLGGLTPSAGLIDEAARCGAPVMVMIRPRAGDFVWSEAELRMMEAEIAATRAAGLAGVVLGASLPDGRLDVPSLRRLVAAAEGLDLTLHRCIDLVPDMAKALEEAIALGFKRSLTSGGEKTAEAGAGRIAGLVNQAAGRISIMPGSGVTPANAGMLMGLGISELHASCSVTVQASGRVVEMGFGPAQVRQTSADQVRALKRALY
jgi:copper homeostasis protein